MNSKQYRSFVFYESFLDALDVVPETMRLRGYEAIANFAIREIEPEFSAEEWPLEILFRSVRVQIEKNLERRKQGEAGGRPDSGVAKEDVEKKYEELGNWDAVADFFGVDRSTVYRIRNGVAKPSSGVAKPAPDVAKPNVNANGNGYVNADEDAYGDAHGETVAAKPPCPQKPPVKRFQKPTVEEVRAYCQSRRNNIDAEAFIAFYDSKGWVVGNSPMKDWKAAVITWEKRPERAQPSLFQQRASPIRQVDAVISDALLAKL